MGKIAFLCFLVLSLIVIAPPPAPAQQPAPKKIVFGQAIGLTGPMGAATAFLETPATQLWLQELKAKGGLYVKEYGKRLPVELIQYDDKGDVATTVKLYQKLITVDKVDVLLPPEGTGYHVAIAPLCNQHKYSLVTMSCGSEKLREVAPKFPYFFVTINMPRDYANALVELMGGLGVKTAAMVYVSHEYGIDCAATSGPLMGASGIDVVMFKAYPLSPTDLSPLLKEAKAANVDALIAHSYVADTLLLVEQAKVIGFNPKLFYVAIAGAWPLLKEKFGTRGVEGVISPGGWNPGLPYPKAKEYYDKFLKLHGRSPDYWSGPYAYALLEVYEQAIGIAGFRNREKLRNVIASETFDTVIGPVKFVDQFNIYHPSQLGQWQNGIFQAIAPKKTMTADPIYPKPEWPR